VYRISVVFDPQDFYVTHNAIVVYVVATKMCNIKNNNLWLINPLSAELSTGDLQTF